MNWAGNVTFSAGEVHVPGSVSTVQAIVTAASSAGRRVHAIGSRHSFSTVADVAAGGDLIALDGMNRIVEIDREAMTVTVEGGTRYGQLSAALHAAGLALHNLPSLPQISVAGAVATATHGSGNRNGNLATAVRAVELVVADGSLLRLTPDDPRFHGAVVHLGALGVVVRLTLAVEPTFDVAQTIYCDLPFDAAVAHLDELMSGAYSVSLFTDYRRNVFQQAWRKGRIGVDRPAPSELLGVPPATQPVHPVAGVSATSCTEQLGRPGPWADRLPHFRLGFEPSSGDELQSEYFVARADGAAAVCAVQALRDVLSPVIKVGEVRSIGADDLWLSTAHARNTLALHFTWVNDQPRVMAFLPLLEAALAPFDARPHWGKLTAMAPAHVRSLYPSWDDFVALRTELDPGGTFLNPYVREFL